MLLSTEAFLPKTNTYIGPNWSAVCGFIHTCSLLQYTSTPLNGLACNSSVAMCLHEQGCRNRGGVGGTKSSNKVTKSYKLTKSSNKVTKSYKLTKSSNKVTKSYKLTKSSNKVTKSYNKVTKSYNKVTCVSSICSDC